MLGRQIVKSPLPFFPFHFNFLRVIFSFKIQKPSKNYGNSIACWIAKALLWKQKIPMIRVKSFKWSHCPK